MTERQQLIERMKRTREEIGQIFTDAATWNENHRPAGEAPIDPDPDGELLREANSLDQAIERVFMDITVAEAIQLQRELGGGVSYLLIKGEQDKPLAAVIIIDGAGETQAILSAVDEVTRTW